MWRLSSEKAFYNKAHNSNWKHNTSHQNRPRFQWSVQLLPTLEFRIAPNCREAAVLDMDLYLSCSGIHISSPNIPVAQIPQCIYHLTFVIECIRPRIYVPFTKVLILLQIFYKVCSRTWPEFEVLITSTDWLSSFRATSRFPFPCNWCQISQTLAPGTRSSNGLQKRDKQHSTAGSATVAATSYGSGFHQGGHQVLRCGHAYFKLGALKPASNDFAYFFSTFPKFNVIRCATSP